MSDVHAAVGSYAVDALSPAERAEFEKHLAGCASCRREAAEFAETLAELTPLTAAAPPATLRNAILASVVDGAQAPHRRQAVGPPPAAEVLTDGKPEAAPRRALPPQVTQVRPGGPEEVAPLEEHPSVRPDQSWVDVTAALSQGVGPVRAPRRDRLPGILVAAALVLALLLSGAVYVLWEQNRASVLQAQQETELLTARDVEVLTGSAGGAPVSFVVSRARDRALFACRGLRDPGPGRTFQLWIVRDGTPRPAGLVREGGDVRQWLEGSLADVDRLELSEEPSRGSGTPTQRISSVDVPT